MQEHLEAEADLHSNPMTLLLDLREGKTAAEHVLETQDSLNLFAQYLEFIRRMVEYVDRMEDHK
jgi:hypothetical protein